MFVELTDEEGKKVVVNSNYVEKFRPFPCTKGDEYWNCIVFIAGGGPTLTPPLKVREDYEELKQLFRIETKKVINE